MSLSRRQILVGGAAGLALSANACQMRPRLDPGSSVLVVGAGFAGIGAARDLQRAGYEVTILEAQNRIGGRAKTVSTFGTPLDLGASWLHYGEDNVLAPLARQSGIGFHVSDYDKATTFDLGSDPVAQRDIRDVYRDVDIEARFENVLTGSYLRWRAGRLWGAMGSGRSIHDAWQAAMSDVGAFNADTYRVIMETQYAVPLEEEAIEMMYLGSEALPNHEWLMTGGMQAFAEWLASDLSIQLDTTVSEIAWDESGAWVTSNRGDFNADAVVLTTSVGLLKSGSIRLTPGLPQAHRRALNRVGMALLNKIALKYPAIDWPMDDEFWVLVNSELSGIVMNYSVASGTPVLIALTGGNDSRAVEALSDEAAAGSVHRALEKAFGRRISEPEATLVTRWASDPFALGSYSHRKPGANLNEDNILARPIDDRLFLAGEAIVDDYDVCNVSGAFTSGRRAARQIIGRS